MTSNLLSGYIGNSFIAVYALINPAWSIYMWRKAGSHMSALRKSPRVHEDMRRRLVSHNRKRKLYAAVNVVSVIVSSVGSLYSAEHWQGYVVVAPFVFALLFANLFWMYALGYNRAAFDPWTAPTQHYDIHAGLRMLHHLRSSISPSGRCAAKLGGLLSSETGLGTQDVLDIMRQLGLASSFGAHLLQRNKTDDGRQRILPGSVTLYWRDLCSTDHSQVIQAASAALLAVDQSVFRDQERFLLELYGCYLQIAEERSRHSDPRRQQSSLDGHEEKQVEADAHRNQSQVGVARPHDGPSRQLESSHSTLEKSRSTAAESIAPTQTREDVRDKTQTDAYP
jgi:hypothetical protein